MSQTPSRARNWSIIGVIVAIAITAIIDLSGLSLFSALSLLPLLLVLSWLQKLNRTDLGLVWGRPRHYGLAMLYPLFVIGLTVLIALMAGATDASEFDWLRFAKNLLLMSVTGIPMLVLTEEGFFRGWLWASLGRSGESPATTLLWSSSAFSLWHFTWAILDSGLGLPPQQVPVYLANAAVMGLGWGLLRWISGSVIVASASHAVWNAFAYTLFGAGPMEGSLRIRQSLVFDVETGLVGLILNLLFALGLWTAWQRRSAENR